MKNYFIFIIFSLITINCHAISLMNALDAAYKSDPKLQSSRFALDAARKEEDIGLSYLLPTLSAGGKLIKSTGVTDLDQNTITGNKNYSSNNDYTSRSTTLTLRQPIFDLERLALYNQGEIKKLIGEEQYLADEQEFYSRLVENYFNVLKIQHELTLIDAQKKSIEGLVKQTKSLFNAGEGTITDVDEAQARLDLILSQKIDLLAQLQNNQRDLSNQLGQWPDDLIFSSEKIPNLSLFHSGETYNYWREQAYKKSPILAVRTAAVSLAKFNLDQQKSGHMPKVAIAGQLSRSSVDQISSDQDRTDKTIALTVDIPLYAGGGVNAYSQKSLAILNKSQIDLDIARQQIALDIERYYLGVSSGWQKCKALLSAIHSNEKAVLSAEKGFQAGTRSTIDILDAQERVFSAKRDLLNTKLIMLLSLVKLKVAIGEMNKAQLQQIEYLLQ